VALMTVLRVPRWIDRQTKSQHCQAQRNSYRVSELLKCNGIIWIYMDDCYIISSERDCRIERVNDRGWRS
jgi:hypothetical protein